MQYRRAASQSADVALSVARRVYRPVVKDPAVWGVSKPMAGPRTRRHFVPSAQETKVANRRRFGRRTRPDRDAGEVATSIKGAWDQPQAGPCPRCNLVKRLLAKRPSEPQTFPKGLRPFHPQDGAPARKRRGRGGEKHVSGLLPPFPTRKKRFQSAKSSIKTLCTMQKKPPAWLQGYGSTDLYGWVRNARKLSFAVRGN